MSNGLIQLTSSEIKHKINHQKLFRVDDLFEYLFNLCKICLTADKKQIDNFSYYDLRMKLTHKRLSKSICFSFSTSLQSNISCC